MSNAQENQPFQFKQLEKFQMYTDAPGAEGRRSSLHWSTYRGNPRITVFTGVPNDSGKGVINAAMNPETFLVFLDLFEKVCLEDRENKYKIVCYTVLKPKEGAENKPREKVHASDLWFGKDNKGLVWISVTAENRPKIKFDFKISDFHQIFKGDGSPINESEASSLQALACAKALRDVIVPHMADLKAPYNPDVAKKADGGKTKFAAESNIPMDEFSF